MPTERTSLTVEGLGLSLPYSIEAEQAVLGAAILNHDLVPQMVSRLRQEYFYSRQNGEIFAEISAMSNMAQAVDFVTLLGRVTDANIFENGEAAKVYLTDLAQTVPHLSNMDSYMDIIEEKYQIRMLMGAAAQILDMAGKEPDAKLLLETAEQKIYEIRRGRDQSVMQSMRSVLLETLAYLQEITGKGESVGVPTGFGLLDRILSGGFGKSDLVILAARPGMGKTTFALNIATNVAKKAKIPVAVFSLEMSKDQLVTKILSSEAAVSSQALRTGNLTASDWQDIAVASEYMGNMPVFLDDTPSITTAEIKAKIRRLNQDPERPDIGLIVIDYLQLMNSGIKTDSRVQAVSEITRNLKILAKELQVPVLCLSQLNRSTERGSATHRPGLSDLRDSGSIEQDADEVLFLLREAYYDDGTGENEVDTTTAICIVAKNRHGETGDVPLGWDGAHSRFVNVEYNARE
ncbi:MAG: replicative DNA helicase [Oscillospiraceae bacterium]|nr:replicative DNA helicase [Oscillospiraceae bacterium]